jgi:3'(2'), 5'-bisphosphate nucleotidase
VDRRLLDELVTIVSAAAASIMAVRAGALDAEVKSDQSPVTAADRAAQAVILQGLSHLLPGVTVVSEEVAALPASIPNDFILVDPLDGTRELIAGRDEFTINLALVSGARPRLGIIAAPARGILWCGIDGTGAERMLLPSGAPVFAARERRPIYTRPWPSSGPVATVSRSHLDPATEAFLRRLPITQCMACGSALKFCAIAEGTADVYPRLSTTCEWDIAAGHAIVTAAGGTVLTPDVQSLEYGGISRQMRLPAFVAWGDPRAQGRFGC